MNHLKQPVKEKPFEPQQEGWAEKELELLNQENLLMPKMYSFTEVKALLTSATREARREELAWVLNEHFDLLKILSLNDTEVTRELHTKIRLRHEALTDK